MCIEIAQLEKTHLFDGCPPFPETMLTKQNPGPGVARVDVDFARAGTQARQRVHQHCFGGKGGLDVIFLKMGDFNAHTGIPSSLFF